MMDLLLKFPLEYYAYSALFNFFTCLTIIGMVLWKKRNSELIVLFVNFTGMIAAWSLVYFIWLFSNRREIAEFFLRTDMVFVSFLPPTFLHFVSKLVSWRAPKWVHPLNYIAGLLITPVMYTNWFATSVAEPHLVFPYWLRPQWFFIIHLLHFFVSIGGGHLLMLRMMRSPASSPTLKRQISIVFWGTLIGFGGGISNYLSWYRLPVPPIPMPIVSFYVIALAYAVIRYRLMDINIVITRTAVFMGVNVGLLFAPLWGASTWETQLRRVLVGENWWLWMWGVAAGLTVIAYYVNLHFQRRAEERLFRQQRRYQQALQAASMGMTQIRELKRLVGMIVYVVTRTVGLSQAAIFLGDSRTGVLTLGACRYRRSMSPVNRLSKDDPLIVLLGQEHQPLVLDELKAQFGEAASANGNGAVSLQAQAIAQMEALRASVVIPSFRWERLMGFLMLGEKHNRQLFTTEDLIVFSTLANQAAVAIENARFYEADQQRQAAMFHTASLASLGTMASSMGHQVNNRFNVISVVASAQKMRIEELLKQEEQPDVETLRQAAEECLAEFKSLQEEALRGGEVVSAIRKITHASTEGYEPVSIGTAIQAGFDVVRYKPRFEEIDVRRELPEDLPPLYGDLAQLGECFLNLIDNAYDAILERIEKLKPQNYQGRITIKATVEPAGAVGRCVAIEVSDNGIGILDKERAQLFTPFFTTKLSSDKGTGLGLYVIKRIIEAHGGAIALASTYGVGTTFTLRLPTSKEPVHSQPSTVHS